MSSPRTSTRHPLRSARSRRFIKSDHRGAALVEAAIIFIPLCIIVFGIIEYGFIFKDSLTLSSATRAGARAASAQPKVDSATFFPYVRDAVARAATAASFQNGDQMWIYKANASGDPTGTCPGTECVVYTYNNGWPATTTYGWDSLNNVTACLGGGAVGGNIDSVGIRLQLSHDAITGWFHDMQLHEKTVMRFEPTTSSCP
jgi:Flp pilus assembly protein TadG